MRIFGITASGPGTWHEHRTSVLGYVLVVRVIPCLLLNLEMPELGVIYYRVDFRDGSVVDGECENDSQASVTEHNKAWCAVHVAPQDFRRGEVDLLHDAQHKAGGLLVADDGAPGGAHDAPAVGSPHHVRVEDRH